MERTSSGFYIIDVFPLHQTSKRPFHLEHRMRMKLEQRAQQQAAEGVQLSATADQAMLTSPRSELMEQAGHISKGEIGASAAADLLAAELKRQRILEERRGKLAKRYAHVKHIMKSKQLEREKKRRGLATSLKLAEKKRNAILQRQVGQCARAVQRAREVARRHTMQIDEEMNRKRHLLETKIRKSSARREKFLANERRMRSRASSEEMMVTSPDDDVAMDYDLQQDHGPASPEMLCHRAAVLIQRWYRHRKVLPLILEFRKHTAALDVDIARELPFQNVCALIQPNKVVKSTHMLLRRAFKAKTHVPMPPATSTTSQVGEAEQKPIKAGLKPHSSPAEANPSKKVASNASASDQRYKTPARVFLSAYMVVAHTDSILTDVHKEMLEKRLLVTAMTTIQAFEKWTALVLDERDKGFSLSTTDPAGTTSSKNPEPLSPTKRKFGQDDIYPMTQKQTAYQALHAFLNAWHTYHHAFTLWKQRDTMKLLNSMTQHFLQLDAMWETIRNTSNQQGNSPTSASADKGTMHPAVESEWRPRIAMQRAEIKQRVLKLGGTAALERMLAKQAEERERRRTEAGAAGWQGAEGMSIADVRIDSSIGAATTGGRQKVRLFDVNQAPPVDSVSMATRAGEAIPPILSPASFAVPAGQPSPLQTTRSMSDATALLEALTVASPTKPNAAPVASCPSAAPNAGAVPSVHQSMPRDYTISNEALAHELIMDPDFQLQPRQRTEAQEAARNKAMDEFFNVMRDDLRNGDMRRWLPGLVADLRDRLNDLTPESGPIRRQVQEVLDQDLIMQQVNRGMFDLEKMFSFIVDIMKQICAPMRDQEIERITSEEMPAHERARRILGILDNMRLDLANFRLQALRPHLKQMAVEYESGKFEEALESGRSSLDNTTRWLKETVDVLKKVKRERDPEGVALPDASIRYEDVYVEALLGLIIAHPSGTAVATVGPTSGVSAPTKDDLTPAQLSLKTRLDRFSPDQIPETLKLDRDRIISYSNEAHVLTLVSALVTMSRNLHPELRTVDTPRSKKMISTLLVLLRDDLTISVDSLTIQIVSILEEVNQVRPGGGDGNGQAEDTNFTAPAAPSRKPLSEEARTLVRSLVEKTVGGRDHVYKLIARRLSNALRHFIINGGSMMSDTALASTGLKPVEADLFTLARKVYALARHNREVYAKWYDKIIREAMDTQQ